MKIVNFILIASLLIVITSFFVGAIEVVSVNAPTVCCEKTNSGLYCQDVPSEECSDSGREAPTSCESTSYCKTGYCFDSSQGTCLDNTPQLVCNQNGGIWSENEPAQCQLGCCVLGDQAAFVTLTRCKKLSSDLGLLTNYRSDIKNELACVLSVSGQEKGACVYDFEFERTCKFTTRAECGDGIGSGNATGGVKGEFFEGKLCSSEELKTNCGFTQETMIVSGKEGVYFKDSCGNPANIYDSSKLNDKEYWSNVKDSSESCGFGKDNANSKTCGNCNYLLGSFGREANSQSAKPSYGNYICSSLNCEDTSNGNSYKHGESWCVYNDVGETGESINSVGSRFYKHICINGEEVVEACADFRQEECVEDKIETSLGEFSQAACRVNRWQDCTAQDNQLDCENTDRRDCNWREGDFNVALLNESQKGICLPQNTPGIKFWEGDEAQQICAQGNSQCIVSFEKGLFGGEKCVDGCECLTETWEKEQAELCVALGDCGPNINWLGQQGYKKGYEIKKESISSKK